MAQLKRMLLPVALVASMLHGLVLTGCGGGSSPTGPSEGARVRMIFSGLPAARVATGGARSASVGGAEVFVDGISAGHTDADGEIVLQLAPGTHAITVTSGGAASDAFEVTVADGDVLTLEVEMESDGTLVVEQDTDHDGDYDDDDDSDDEDEDDADEDEDDEDETDDDEDEIE